MWVRVVLVSQSGCMYRNTVLDASQSEKSQGRGGAVSRGREFAFQFLVSGKAVPGLDVSRPAIKKRPELFSAGRPGSPPPELPNHELDTRPAPSWCKRHFGNTRISASHIGNGGRGNTRVMRRGLAAGLRIQLNPLIVIEILSDIPP